MWFAHVTVANVVVRDERYLMVKERQDGKVVINQPAGHLEEGETLAEALIRETLEETQWEVKPIASLGVSQYLAPNGTTYIRHTFLSEPIQHRRECKLDEDIDEVCWMTLSDITEHSASLRSPLVLNDIKRFQEGIRFPIETLYFNAM